MDRTSPLWWAGFTRQLEYLPAAVWRTSCGSRWPLDWTGSVALLPAEPLPVHPRRTTGSRQDQRHVRTRLQVVWTRVRLSLVTWLRPQRAGWGRRPRLCWRRRARGVDEEFHWFPFVGVLSADTALQPTNTHTRTQRINHPSSDQSSIKIDCSTASYNRH